MKHCYNHAAVHALFYLLYLFIHVVILIDLIVILVFTALLVYPRKTTTFAPAEKSNGKRNEKKSNENRKRGVSSESQRSVTPSVSSLAFYHFPRPLMEEKRVG